MGHKLKTAGRYGLCKEGRESKPSHMSVGCTQQHLGTREGWTLRCSEAVKGSGAWGRLALSPLGWAGGKGRLSPPSSLLPWFCPTYFRWQGVVKGRASGPHLRHPTQLVLWLMGKRTADEV